MIAVVIEAREKSGKSQRDVSAELKMPINFAHLVESGERMLSAVEVPDYAKAIGLTAATLYERMATLDQPGLAIPNRVDARKRRRRPGRKATPRPS